jgi:HYR domain-containing protein
VSRVTGPGRVGTDTWAGTLTVPGLDFDVTAPLLHGAVNRLTKAPRGAKYVRVTYKVTATDEIAGTLPASCRPASGSRFPIGRTTVSCSATDTSGNTATAKFTITVKARR